MELKTRLEGFSKLDNYKIKHESQINSSLGIANKRATYIPIAIKIFTPLEIEFKQSIHTKLLDTLDLSLISGLNNQEARQQIRKVTQRLIDEQAIPLNNQICQQIITEIENDILGLGPIEALLHDPTISDILVNGFDKVYVERFGKLELTLVKFNDNNHLMKIIDRIVTKVGRRIDESSPMVDARLADGSRVNAIIPPLAIDGPSLSIRRFAVIDMALDDLVEKDELTDYMAEFLKAAAQAKDHNH